MKVPISEYACVSLDAPVISAYEVNSDGVIHWVVWCGHCATWHWTGAAEGHREAHCRDPDSPCWRTGYNLAYAGRLRSYPMV